MEFRFAVGGVHRRKVTVIAAGKTEWQASSEGTALTAQEQGQQIRERLKEYKLGKTPVVVLADRSKVEELNLSLPSVPDAELPPLVLNQALLESPGLTEETIVDFVPLRVEDSETSRKVIALAMTPKTVEGYQAVCQQAGLQLTGIQYRPYAACVPVRESMGEVLETTSLVVTPYRDDVELSVLDGDEVPLSRQVRLPGLQADEGVQERLIGEIRRTLLTAPQHLTKGREIQDLRVCGTSDGTADLIKRIGEETGLPVLRIDPTTSAGVSVEGDSPLVEGFTPLLGVLQLAALDRRPAIDFLAPHKPIVRQSNTRTLVLGGLLLLTAGYFGFDFLQQQMAAGNEQLNELRKTLAELKSDLKKLDKEKNLANNVLNWEASTPNWLEELRDFSQRIPPGEDVTLSRLTLSPGRGAGGAMSFAAAARSPDAVVALEKSLRDDRHAIQTPGIVQRSDKNYPWGFESTITISKKAAVKPIEKPAENPAEKPEEKSERPAPSKSEEGGKQP